MRRESGGGRKNGEKIEMEQEAVGWREKVISRNKDAGGGGQGEKGMCKLMRFMGVRCVIQRKKQTNQKEAKWDVC